MAENKSEAVYGVRHVKLAESLTTGLYPDFATAPIFNVRLIADGSFTFNDSAPSTTDVNVEDLSRPMTKLSTDGGVEGFTLETYDLSTDAFEYLKGYVAVPTSDADNTNKGWTVSTPGFILPAQAVQIETLPIDDFPAKIFEYAKMKVTVVKGGSVGKGGHPNFNLTFEQLANTNASGVEISGDRNKTIVVA